MFIVTVAHAETTVLKDMAVTPAASSRSVCSSKWRLPWGRWDWATPGSGRDPPEIGLLLEAAGTAPRPVMQPLHVDLSDDPDAPAQPIHLGIRAGVTTLREHLRSLQGIGIHHVALNLRFNRRDVDTTLRRLAQDILPEFAS